MTERLDLRPLPGRWTPVVVHRTGGAMSDRVVWRGRTYDLSNVLDVVDLSVDLELDDSIEAATHALETSEVHLAHEAGEQVTAREVLDLATPAADPGPAPLTPATVRLRRGPEMDHHRRNYPL